jgi:hypothetical protein
MSAEIEKDGLNDSQYEELTKLAKDFWVWFAKTSPDKFRDMIRGQTNKIKPQKEWES